MKDFLMQLVNASFQGGVIIAVVMLLRLVLRKTPKSTLCLLWLLAIVRLLLPIQLESNLSLQPDVEILSKNEYYQTEFLGQQLSEYEPAVPMETIQVDDGQVIEPVYSDAVITPEHSVTIDWVSLLPWLWLSVAVGLALWSILSYLRLRSRTKNAIVLGDGVWLSPELDSAFVLGFMKPQIYLPVKLDQQEQTLVIAHERAHIRRFDHWYKLLGFITLCVHWFNPLVWMAYIFLCRDMEMACDEQVVRDMDTNQRKAYSMALLRCSADSHHFKPCPVAFAEVSVKDRIKGVLHYKKPGFWAALVGIVAIVFVAVCFLTSPAGSDGQPPKEVENLLTTYLDTMKEDMVEAASYHYFADPTVESIYKESKDYLTDYEILSWEKIGHEIWVAEVNLKCLSYDDWKSYYQFIGKIDGQYRVVYDYDIDETDDFNQGIDLSPYLDLDDNTIFCPLEAYSDEELRQHCIDLMKLLRASEYQHILCTYYDSTNERTTIIEQIEIPGFHFFEQNIPNIDSPLGYYQTAAIMTRDGDECYTQTVLNPGDGAWVLTPLNETPATWWMPKYLYEELSVFETCPLEVYKFETGIRCVFTNQKAANGNNTMEFRFGPENNLTSIVETFTSFEGNALTSDYDILWETEDQIQQLADDLLAEAREHAAYQEQLDELELSLEETAIRAAITQHFEFRKRILLDGVTEIPEMDPALLSDELRHKQLVDADSLKRVDSEFLITEIILQDDGSADILVTETVYYEIDDETLADPTLDEVIVHMIRLADVDGDCRVIEDAYREWCTNFNSRTFNAYPLEQAQKRIVANAVEEYFSFKKEILCNGVTVVPEMHPLRLKDKLAHKQALDDAGIQWIESSYVIEEIDLWDREYADVTLTETVTYTINGETKQEIIEHNIVVIGVQTNAYVIDDGYFEPFSGFRSSSYVDPSELP